MTTQELEVLAETGTRLQIIVSQLRVPARVDLHALTPAVLVGRMDAACIGLTEIYAILAALPHEEVAA